MSLVNERHIDTDRAGDAQGGGNFPTLMDFMNRRRVVLAPFNEADQVANAQHVLINSADFPGVVALGTSSEESTGGYNAAALPGAINNADNVVINDALGNVTNLVEVRDSTTHDPIMDSSGRKVYGLLQAASTVADGDAVGAAGAENLQVSFVIIDASGAMVLVAVNATVEFAVPRMYAERHLPSYYKEGSTAEVDIITPSVVPGEPVTRKFDVTAQFAANEVITVSTGAGAGTGTATPTGDVIASLGATPGDFNNDNRTRVRLNGTQLNKGEEAVWDSATTFHMNVIMDVGDTFEIEVAQ